MNTTDLRRVLDEIAARWGIPGLAVGLVEGDEIAFAEGFGVQNLVTQVPVTPRSIFCVASVSKCFVATAIMRLADQGQIDLDTPIVHYLPYFRLDDERSAQITVRSILSHTSGIPDMDESEYDDLVGHSEIDDGAAERYVRGLSRRRMVGYPGEKFLYSNIGYNVLGDLISKVSGTSFEEYMTQYILLPAGMSDSTFFFPEVDKERLAVPHLRTPAMQVSPVYPYHRADAPASFLHSTVVDMCNWGITCLNRGTFEGRQILSQDKYPLMWTPVTPRHYPPFYEHTGLGWTLGHYEGYKTVSHGGMGFGWTDFFVVLPEINRAAVIMSNEESSARESTLRAAVDTLLGRKPQVGPISWMIPIGRALQAGGIQAAYDCWAEIQGTDNQQYSVKAGELIPLVYQLVSAGKTELAKEVLRLNMRIFPDHTQSCQLLNRLEEK